MVYLFSLEPADLFAEGGGGSIGEADLYDFKATLATPVPDMRNVTWELWNNDGIDTEIATGGDLLGQARVGNAGDRFVRFYQDHDVDNEWDSGEPVIDKTFDMKGYMVHLVGIARASTTVAF